MTGSSTCARKHPWWSFVEILTKKTFGMLYIDTKKCYCGGYAPKTRSNHGQTFSPKFNRNGKRSFFVSCQQTGKATIMKLYLMMTIKQRVRLYRLSCLADSSWFVELISKWKLTSLLCCQASELFSVLFSRLEEWYVSAYRHRHSLSDPGQLLRPLHLCYSLHGCMEEGLGCHGGAPYHHTGAH